MARLAIDRDFLDDYSKLPKPVQASVKMAIDKFAEHVHATSPISGSSDLVVDSVALQSAPSGAR